MMNRVAIIILTTIVVFILSSSLVFAGVGSYQLKLKKGRNFVSIPLSIAAVEGANNVENLFGDKGLAQIESVEYFDAATDQWLIYDTTAPGDQDLRNINDATAFFVYAKEKMTIDIIGTEKDFIEITLAAGWNAIGVAAPLKVSEFDEKTANFNIDYDRIYRFNDKGELVTLLGTDELKAGEGYWLNNDPDMDGVSSSDELSIHGSSPFFKDLEISADGTFKKATVIVDADSIKTKIDYLKTECSELMPDPDTLDSLYEDCKKWVTDYSEYKLAGPDISLGGFTITHVRYKLDDNDNKIAGVGLLKPWNIPKDLSPLFSLDQVETVFLDMKDEKVLRAVDETPGGFIIGGSNGLVTEKSKIDYITIDEDGELESSLTDVVVDGLPKRNYFLRWSPPKRTEDESNTNFIQLGMYLGDEDIPGDELTVSRVWYVDGVGQTKALMVGESNWHLNLPPSASGVFDFSIEQEPDKTFNKDKAITCQVTHTRSPFAYLDPIKEISEFTYNGTTTMADILTESKFTWLPALAVVEGDEIVFTGKANSLKILSGLKALPAYTDIYLKADEKGRISISGIGPKFSYEKGALSITLGEEGGPENDLYLKLNFKGWSLTPKVNIGLLTRGILSWEPSVVLSAVLSYEPLRIKEGSVFASVSAEGALKIYEMDISNAQKYNNFDRAMLDGEFSAGGKFILDVNGTEVGVNAKWLKKIEESYKDASTDKERKGFISTDGQMKYTLSHDDQWEFSYLARIRKSWLQNDIESSRDDYNSTTDIIGEGRIRIDNTTPFFGGKDISARYKGTIKHVGLAADGINHDYKASSYLSAGFTQGSDQPLTREGDWGFSLDELRIDLGEVEINGVKDENVAAVKYMSFSKPSIKKISGYMTVMPPEDFSFFIPGPYAASFSTEKKAPKTENTPAVWRFLVNAELNVRIPLGTTDLDDQGNPVSDYYIVLKELSLIKDGTSSSWQVMTTAELHFNDGVYTGTLIYDAGAWMFIAQGCDMGDFIKGVDLIVRFEKKNGKLALTTTSISGTIAGKAIADLLGGQYPSQKTTDLTVSGTKSGNKLILQVDNLPINWDVFKGIFAVDKVRNVTYIREKKSAGTSDWSFSFDVDVVVERFADDNTPKEEWPRLTLGGFYSPKGIYLSGKNFPTIWLGKGGKLNILELSGGVGGDNATDDMNAKFSVTGKVVLPEAWVDGAAKVIALPSEVTIRGEFSKLGFLAGFVFDSSPIISMGGGVDLKVKEMTFKKMSPWASGLGSTLSIGGKEIEGIVELGENPRFVPADSETGFTIDLTGGYKVTISNLAINFGPGFAMSGDALITMPEKNVLNGVVGNSFAAKISGSPEKFTFSTDTNISSTMEMGLLGKGAFTITNLALSSDGAFAGSGSITLGGQTTSFVIGTTVGGGVYFTADFGATGIDIQLAQIFMLKIRNKIGLESLGAYQYVRIDDLKTALGNDVAGADVATNKFLYFLPSSIPPAGFAFFDNLNGKVSIAGFSVGLGMSFPAPEVKDIGPVMTVLGQAITGGTVNLSELKDLSAPAFTLRDVYMNFPKVPGVEWKDGRLQQTDNLFKSMFGSDKLTIVSSKSLKPADFIQVVTAESPLELIKVVVPADMRKGSLGMNILGFNAAVNYDLKEDQILYEMKSVAKLPDIYKLIGKVRYVDQSAGELPAELKGSGGTVSSGITGNYIELRAKHSGKSLDVSGVSTAAGANVHQWGFVNGDNQLWRLIPDGGDFYRIEAKHSGKCLDVAGAGTQNGTNVLQWDCNGADNQKWKAIPQGDNYYQLQAKHSGKCLDVAGAGKQNGTNVQQWACVAVDQQKWLISPGAGGNRSKTMDIAMPAAQGSGTAKVTWTVEDITAELKAIKEMVSAITPPQNSTWQDHFTYVWNTYFPKGLSYSGNRATFKYSPTISAELELTEYDGTLDVTGIKFANNQLTGRFGSATLYADQNFEGNSFAVSSDLSFYELNSAIGNDNLSSVKIDGRGKITLYRDANFGAPSTEVTGSLDTIEESAVMDNDTSSIKVYYPLSTGKVTGWRLILKSDKGIVTTVDAGGIEVVFPGDQKVLGLLPNGRMYQAIADTKNILNDLKPYPALQTDAATFLKSFWDTKVLPIKSSYVDGTDDLTAADKPVEFKKGDGSIIGFQPTTYGGDKKISGFRFDKNTGVLTGKFGKITLYGDGDYGGKNLLVEDDIPDLGQTPFGNDGASSLKVEDNGLATLYSDTNYADRWYYDYTTVKAKHSGKCMDESTVSNTAGGNIHQWECVNGNNQRWKLVPVGDDYYNLVAKHSGQCVTVGAGSTANGGNIVQYGCDDLSNRKWKLISKGGGYYQLKAKNSGRCADVSGASTGNSANILQWDCHEGNNQQWLINLAKITYSKTEFNGSDAWLGNNSIGNDTVRSVKVFNPLEIKNINEWRIQRSTPSGGTVTLAYAKDSKENTYKTVISTELQATGNKLFSYYDTDNGNALTIKAFAKSDAEFPLTNYRAYVKGTPYDLTDITEAAQYIRVVTKTLTLPDNTKVVMNEDGGFSTTYDGVTFSPAEGGPATTAFTLAGPDNMSLRFNSTKTGGIGKAEIVGSNPVEYASLYQNDAGVPLGIKKVIGKVDGGFFLDASLAVGTTATVKVDLKVSGAIKTDGNFYLKGNGDLIIANYTVSKAIVELSSDNGLYIRGVMDLNAVKVEIEGYLKPNGEFSFTGVAQAMVSGTGVKGSLAVNNSGVNINGGLYIANAKIANGIFVIDGGKVSWKTNVGIGYAGFDSTIIINLGQVGAGYTGRAYINLDVPIYAWGPKGWKCKKRWGIKICWPTGWGNIRVATLPLHFNQSVNGSLDGSKVSIKLGPAALKVDVAKPSVSASW